MIKRLIFATFLVLLAVFTTVKLIGRPTRFTPAHIQSELESAELRYFLEQAHPVSGLVRDAALNFAESPQSNRMSSIAATGFGMAVLANAASRGMIDPTAARDYVLKTLRFCRDHVERRKGWFLHFVDWETGERFDRSEYSSIDSMFFVAGALYAAQLLHDPEIAQISHQMYVDMDFWDLMTDGGRSPEKRTLSMSFTRGENYNTHQWNMYAEQQLLLLMGMGHPTHPLPAEVWQAYERPLSRLPNGEKVMGLEETLAAHQGSNLFIDFHGFHDGYPNYFANGLIATRYQRNMTLHSDPPSRTLNSGFWGFSAGAAPHDTWEAWSPTHHRDLVCLDCAIASAMFLPDEIMGDASMWALGPYHKEIWGRYGFVDSIDLDHRWFADHVYGITLGPAFLSMANMHADTSVWKDFMAIPEIKIALARAAASQPKDGRDPGSVPGLKDPPSFK